MIAACKKEMGSTSVIGRQLFISGKATEAVSELIETSKAGRQLED